ncbi:sigma-54 interaction domain-containing protein [Alteribacillus iranensis]|uniref:HTH-type transcriptional regulatory protein TyrR n=1 Tax=Alteribacillus iranensis TaxID=930128 RepID=A0A1I2FJ20_9BACI|nr:sigma 54-interacting transcriptional regulator [Alteribacillus iranensis]SFF04441.1 PAS domain S-box-containing protein [Alteribacillus iranensis]
METNEQTKNPLLYDSQLFDFVQWMDRACILLDDHGNFVHSNALADKLDPDVLLHIPLFPWKEHMEKRMEKEINGKRYLYIVRKIHFPTLALFHVVIQLKDTLRNDPVLNDVVGYVMDSAQEGIYITDGEGYTLKINDKYSQLTGIARKDVEEKHVSELIIRGFFDSSVTAKVIEAREKQSVMQKINNEKNIWLVTGTPVFDKYHNLILVINTVYDMTKLNELQENLKKHALSIQKKDKEIEKLRSKVKDVPGLVTNSPAMYKVLDRIHRLAHVTTSVFILGETGTGKTMIAEKIHSMSDRKENPFIEVNCAAIPEHLIEAELFGYKKGAFTGASDQGKKGLIEAADGGVFFLDEIGEMPLSLQAKLLSVLQSKRVRRLGDLHDKEVDIRIIAATNKDPEELIRQNKLRADLYYRLSVVTLHLPALRERKEDIYMIAKNFLDKFNQRHRKDMKFSKEVYFAFEFYSWPGNVRELEHIIEQLVVLNDGPEVTGDDLPDIFQPSDSQTNDFSLKMEDRPLQEVVQDVERHYINELWNKYKDIYVIADKLGVHRTTLLRKAKKLKISLKEEANDLVD